METKEKEYDRFFKATAIMFVEKQIAGTAIMQRKFLIGYNRADRIMNQLEESGIVGKLNGTKPREVLIKDLPSLNEMLSKLDLGEQTLSEPFWK